MIGAPYDVTIAGSVAGSVLVFERMAGVWVQQARLIADDTAAGDYFGASVAIQGDTAIVGAPGNDQGGLVDTGAVYVFTRVGNAWAQRAKLAPAEPAASAGFGGSVSIDAGTLMVGASGSTRIGAVYSFVGADAAWLQEARIVPTSGRSGDYFGTAVALHGDTVVIGAPGRGADPDIRRAGSAFVFLRADGAWTQQAELRAPTPQRDDFFGNSVALHGETALVGAHSYGFAGSDGAAFAFRRADSAWSGPTRLIAPGAGDDGYFGTSVALSGTRAMVGARWDSRAGFLSGAAFVFADTGAGWVLLETLTASDAGTYGEFGSAVAMDGSTAVVGAPTSERVSGSSAGAAYFFTESGSDWVQEYDVDGGDDASHDIFGTAMAVSGDTLIVGAPHETVTSAPDVAAYVFTRAGAEWVLQASLRASTGVSAKHFGASVAVDGDTIAVGTPWDSNGEAVHVFVRADGVWTEQTRIVSPDAAGNNSGRFGASLALHDGTLVVGAPYHYPPGGQGRGAAYVFTGAGSTWLLQAKLSDGGRPGGLGSVVALSGDVAVLGVPECSSSDPINDRALVFVRTGSSWSLEAQLRPDATASCQGFGLAVSLSGDQVLIGAPSANAAYLFGRSGSTWNRLARIDSAVVAEGKQFGRSVSLSQDVLLIGASSSNFDFPEPGEVYVFARSGNHWAPRGAFSSPAGAKDEFGHVVALSGAKALIGVPAARGTFSGHHMVGAVHEYGVTVPLFFSGFE